jgi:hypothetical protein
VAYERDDDLDVAQRGMTAEKYINAANRPLIQTYQGFGYRFDEIDLPEC